MDADRLYRIRDEIKLTLNQSPKRKIGLSGSKDEPWLTLYRGQGGKVKGQSHVEARAGAVVGAPCKESGPSSCWRGKVDLDVTAPGSCEGDLQREKWIVCDTYERE